METADTPIDLKFLKLFRGRGDVYGSWEGGCVKQRLNLSVFLKHLMGSEMIGVYPLVQYRGVWSCVWGCSDIDVDDLDAARNLQTAFSMKDITSWVERTRKGYHVWAFSTALVTAPTMRRAFLAAHQAINYPAKEVNPKQENPGAGYGNYVRLPYPGVLEHGMPENRYMLDDNDQPMQFRDFVEQAYDTRNEPDKFAAVAELYVPPTPLHVVNPTIVEMEVKELLRKLGPFGYTVWKNGPLEGRDRSSVLFKLGCIAREAGLTPDEAVAVVKSADERWGKFYLRPNGDKEILTLIERAYSRA